MMVFRGFMNVLTISESCVGMPIKKIKKILYLIKNKYKNVINVQIVIVSKTNL